jgi:hypothetical protein
VLFFPEERAADAREVFVREVFGELAPAPLERPDRAVPLVREACEREPRRAVPEDRLEPPRVDFEAFFLGMQKAEQSICRL